MSLTRRLTIIAQGNLNSLMDRLEDPEQSLHQVILELEEQLEISKRAVARAIANEDEVESKALLHERAASQWRDMASRSLVENRDDEARDALRRAEQAKRQGHALREQLISLRRDTAEVKESVAQVHESLREARDRQQILHGLMRQTEARKAASKARRGIARGDLLSELDRLGSRVEREAAEERAYQRVDSEISGRSLEQIYEQRTLDDSVQQELDTLRLEISAEAVVE